MIKTDNRGSSGRTTAFEKSIYLLLGHKEAADQAAACRYLSSKGLLKLTSSSSSNSSSSSSNSNSSSCSSSSGSCCEEEQEIKEGVGIYGVSYGGYLSCMSLLLHPDVFSAAVAVAPVTFWEVN